MALAWIRFTSMRATGQVSAHDHGFVARPLTMVFSEGALQQHLRQQRLGVDVGALAEQHEAGEREQNSDSEAGHCGVHA